MSQGAPVAGIIAFVAVLLLVPYILFASLDDWRGPAYGALSFLLIGGVGAVGYRTRGMSFFGAFGEWVQSLGQEAGGRNSSGKQKKAKRPPYYWTQKLIVAVGDQCEFPRCKHTEYLEVHHIDPYAGGGSNRLENLIVVCPDHHKRFGSGAMSKGRQKEYVRRNNRFKDQAFKDRWAKSVLKDSTKEDDEAGSIWDG